MVKGPERHAEGKHAVATEIAGHRLEIDPAKDERKCDPSSDEATPHQKHVRQAAGAAAPPDKEVEQKDATDTACEISERLAHPPASEKRLPAAPPVQPRGRPLQPHRVAVAQAKYRKEAGKGIAYQGGIDVAQIPRTDKNGHCQDRGRNQPTKHRFDLLACHDVNSGKLHVRRPED